MTTMTASEHGDKPDLFEFLHKTMEQVESALDDPKRLSSVKRTLERPLPPLVHVLIRTLAAELDVPFAAVTVLDMTHQHFLATNLGGKIESCSRDASKCQFVIGTGKMLAIHNVEDHSLWRRMWRNVIGNNAPIQAYLGVPLKDEEGEILGAVCVVDTKPRVWTAEEHYAVFECSTLITRLMSTDLST